MVRDAAGSATFGTCGCGATAADAVSSAVAGSTAAGVAAAVAVAAISLVAARAAATHRVDVAESSAAEYAEGWMPGHFQLPSPDKNGVASAMPLLNSVRISMRSVFI